MTHMLLGSSDGVRRLSVSLTFLKSCVSDTWRQDRSDPHRSWPHITTGVDGFEHSTGNRSSVNILVKTIDIRIRLLANPRTHVHAHDARIVCVSEWLIGHPSHNSWVRLLENWKPGGWGAKQQMFQTQMNARIPRMTSVQAALTAGTACCVVRTTCSTGLHSAGWNHFRFYPKFRSGRSRSCIVTGRADANHRKEERFVLKRDCVT